MSKNINDGETLGGLACFSSLDGKTHVVDEQHSCAVRLWVIEFQGTDLEEVDPAALR